MTKTPQELYRERERRVIDAIACRKPDRVPVLLLFGSFASVYGGITLKEEQYDPEKNFNALHKTTVDFEPDMATPALAFGSILEALDYRQLKWAGHGLPDNINYQFVEGEYMTADEYDALLYDPTDFVTRRYWPRIFGKLDIFAQIPPLRETLCYYMGATNFLPFATPAGLEALDAIRKAAEASMQSFDATMGHIQKIISSGFPILFAANTQAPFDTLGDFFRGTKGIMLDMYRRPDKVLAATEKLLPWMLEAGIAGARMSHCPRVFIPLHKGPEGFMSLEQFKRFYWPTFRQLLVGLVNEGLTPIVLAEGRYTSRLETIADVPEGKIVYWFEDTDMARAKEILGGRVCIMGDVPMSLLVGGTPDQVAAYCRETIDVAGRDGGYIMSPAAVMDGAKPENVRAMIDATREYGVY